MNDKDLRDELVDNLCDILDELRDPEKRAQHIMTTYHIGRELGATNTQLINMLAGAHPGVTVAEIIEVLHKNYCAHWLTARLYEKLVRNVARAHREDPTVRAFGGIMKFRAAVCGEREYDA